MKLKAINSNQSRRGSVVLVLLIFLTLMGMLCAATWSAVYMTRQEVALIEKHQIQRLSNATNAPPISNPSPTAP